MTTFNKVFWTIWLLAVIFLAITLVNPETFSLILFLVLLILTGINIYFQGSQKKMLENIGISVEAINFKPIEEGIKKIERQQKECYLRIFGLETELENYKLEMERKYRDVVRKVLELDNKLNKKFKLLGETVVKLSKDIKEKD